jgi:AcrR family transcriptional regulator
MPATRPRAHPRGDARQAILDTAHELFTTGGYDATSVRDVAATAEVSEGLVYRYFGSKRDLFDESVTESYRRYITSFREQWASLGAGVPNEEVVDRYVRGLYRVVVDNSALLFAVTAADRFGTDGPTDSDGLDHTGILTHEVRRLAEVVAGEARERGIEDVDLEMAVTCTTALVLAMGLLDNLLFDKGTEHPDTERLLREMSRFAAAGVRSATAGPQASSTGPATGK